MLALPLSGRRVPPPPRNITPRSSLLRTHAPIPWSSPRLRLLASFVESSQVGTSPCCYRDSPDVIFANLSPDAWSPTPTVPPSAPVRRSNCTDGLPASSFHEDSTLRKCKRRINPIKFTSSYSPYSVASGSWRQPSLRQRLKQCEQIRRTIQRSRCLKSFRTSARL